MTAEEQPFPPRPAPPGVTHTVHSMPVRQTSAMAIVSLVSGLLGWTLLPFLGSLAAVICGHIARAEIRRDPVHLDGDGLAVAGLVLGWVAIILGLLTVIGIIVAIIFFGGLATVLAASGG